MTRFANMLIATAALAACSSGGYSPTDSGNPSPSDQTLTVGVGETVAVGTTGVTIAFLRVEEDSRCPRNVTCFWQGQVKVLLNVSLGGARASSHELIAGQAAAIDAWRLTVTEVNPERLSDARIPLEDYRILLKAE